jgi:acylphosphatase
MPIERRRVLYAGRVQGVGFRYTTHRLAQGFAVSGFVRNLSDGSVELIVEGEPSELAGFLQAIKSEMGHYIHAASEELEPSGGAPLRGFSIRF